MHELRLWFHWIIKILPLIQIMVRRRSGDQPLSGPMAALFDYIYICHSPQWVEDNDAPCWINQCELINHWSTPTAFHRISMCTSWHAKEYRRKYNISYKVSLYSSLPKCRWNRASVASGDGLWFPVNRSVSWTSTDSFILFASKWTIGSKL